MRTPKKPGFDTPAKGGFHITFENGYTVSVQFKAGNYCEHRFNTVLPMNLDDLYVGHSKDAEMAAFNSKGDWVVPEDWTDDVKGYNSPAEVLEFMNYVAGL